MRAALARRRVPAAPSFWSVTTFAISGPRTPAAAYAAGWTLVPFNGKTGLDTAIAGIAANKYIYYSGPGSVPTGTDFAAGTFYNGSGVLTITSSVTNTYVLSGANPAGTAVIDFGSMSATGNTNWGVGTSANYVKFSYTGSSGFNAFWVHDCSNLNIYGGEFTINTAATGEAAAVAFNGAVTNVTWYDSVIHDVPAHGISVNANTSGGAASTIDGLEWRGEVYNWAQNPFADTAHNDKGSGMQGAIMHGSVGTLKNTVVAIYCHDSLAPGATGGNGVVQPEGGGGSCIEVGQSGGSNSNNTYYALSKNNLMTPNGTNPGSTASQFGGQCIEIFGSDHQDGVVIGWAEAVNTSGGCVHGGTGGGWTATSPPIHVLHGRHTNSNQSTAGGNLSIPYDNRYGINYDADCL